MKRPMPLNQNQYGRLRVIHNQLIKGQKRNFDDLKNACMSELSLKELGDRTLKYDIKRLREEFNAPLVWKGGYYYYEEDYSLYDILNPEDVQFAHQMNTLLGKLAELPILKGFEDFQMKIRQRAGGDNNDLIQFDQVEQYTGKEYLPELYQALLDKRCLNITYRNFKGDESAHTLSPYVLREYNNRWYIFGWEHEQKCIFNLALDRILKIKPSAFHFLSDKDNVAAHLADLIGVTRPDGAEPQEVKIRVKKSRAPYLITKPLHKSQRHVPDPEKKDYLLFTFRLILNKELTASLLSLGTDAEVLAPAELREEIAGCARAMWEGYQA
jgi:predicted DNA-binding transcriptional regulator YafY